MDSGLSASDVLALTKDQDGMFGGNGAWIIIILLFLIGGGGFWGNNQGRAATVEDLSNQSNFTRLEDQVRSNAALTERKVDAVQNGLCDGFYAMNTTMGNMRYENAIGQKDLAAQLAECCCKTQTAIHSEGEATRALIQQNKIEALQQRISSLELAAATATTVKYPTTYAYSAGPSPFCGTGYGCNTNI